MRVDVEGGELDETEVDAFVNERWLITVRKNDGFSIAPVLERWDRSPDLAVYGVSFFLYGLLDVIVDSHFDAVQSFDEYYQEVSDGIFAERPLDPPNSATGSTCAEPWFVFTDWSSRCARPSSPSLPSSRATTG